MRPDPSVSTLSPFIVSGSPLPSRKDDRHARDAEKAHVGDCMPTARRLDLPRFRGAAASCVADADRPRPPPTSLTSSARLTMNAVTDSEVRGSNSVVECHLAKVDVEGSNPFSRSKKF